MDDGGGAAGGAGGEQHRRGLVGPEAGAPRRGPGGGVAQAGAEVERAGGGGVADDRAVAQGRQPAGDLGEGLDVVRAGVTVGGDQEDGSGRGQHPFRLAPAEPRREWHRHRTGPPAGQREDGRLPPVGQLKGHHLTGPHTQFVQRGGEPGDLGGEFAEGQGDGPAFLRAPVDDRPLAGCLRGGVAQVVQDGRVAPPALLAVAGGGGGQRPHGLEQLRHGCVLPR
ncbi:anoctamin [Streptomyces laurentii]|uniref:Anoctamin n=1 Tax=Streptomyces laurentii TaxID=39478 RepID=A0A161JGV1_STRLU|nr:anoctamin [Streptomyces laurentii]